MTKEAYLAMQETAHRVEELEHMCQREYTRMEYLSEEATRALYVVCVVSSASIIISTIITILSIL